MSYLLQLGLIGPGESSRFGQQMVNYAQESHYDTAGKTEGRQFCGLNTSF
jgi:hypothetical protein